MNKTFEEILGSGETLYYRNVGDSMYPLIVEGKTLLKISPRPNRPLRRWEIPLYKRSDGKYILHRIVKVVDGQYHLRGDNQIVTERGVLDHQILGLLTSIIQDGEERVLSIQNQRRYLVAMYLRFAFNSVYIRCCRLFEKLKRRFL